jgi:hypothetical protein
MLESLQHMKRRIQLVVKFEHDVTRDHEETGSLIPEANAAEWRELQCSFEKDGRAQLRVTALFTSVSRQSIDLLKSVARQRYEREHRSYDPPNVENYLLVTYEITGKPEERFDDALECAADAIVKQISPWKGVTHCYVRREDVNASLKSESKPIKFPGSNVDPQHIGQAHLRAAPEGLSVMQVWQYAGADGAGQHFMDIERGWQLTHNDLSDASGPRVKHDQSNGGINSTESKNRFHGTCVLGIVCGTHNDLNIVGMTPRLASMQVMSYVNGAATTGTADTVVAAAAQQIKLAIDSKIATTSKADAQQGSQQNDLDQLRPGAVILIEAHATIQGQRYFLPVEIYPDTFDAIKLATDAGITVIEPAGNGRVPSAYVAPTDRRAVDLDEMNAYLLEPAPIAITINTLNRNDVRAVAPSTPGTIQLVPFKDSGAIMVGGATRGVGTRRAWTRCSWSNFGNRIDCFAAGEGVVTLDHLSALPAQFSGTSSASAIIAGAALVVQGVATANRGAPLSPEQLRQALSDPSCGTKSHKPVVDKIGVMPDLMKVVAKHAKKV